MPAKGEDADSDYEPPALEPHSGSEEEEPSAGKASIARKRSLPVAAEASAQFPVGTDYRRRFASAEIAATGQSRPFTSLGTSLSVRKKNQVCVVHCESDSSKCICLHEADVQCAGDPTCARRLEQFRAGGLVAATRTPQERLISSTR